MTVCLILLFQAATMKKHGEPLRSLNPSVSHSLIKANSPYLSYKVNHKPVEKANIQNNYQGGIKYMLKHQLDRPRVEVIAPARNMQNGVIKLQTKIYTFLQQQLEEPERLEELIKPCFDKADDSNNGYLYPPQFSTALDSLCFYNQWPSLSSEEKQSMFKEAAGENSMTVNYEQFNSAAIKLLTKIAYENPPEQAMTPDAEGVY